MCATFTAGICGLRFFCVQYMILLWGFPLFLAIRVVKENCWTPEYFYSFCSGRIDMTGRVLCRKELMCSLRPLARLPLAPRW